MESEHWTGMIVAFVVVSVAACLFACVGYCHWCYMEEAKAAMENGYEQSVIMSRTIWVKSEAEE